MKRTIPLLITAFGGIVLVIAFFIPAFESWGEEASIWFDILAAIAFILGGGNLFKVHLKTISDRQKGWGFSAVTLTAFLLMLLFGLFKFGSRPSPSTEFYGQSLVDFPLAWMPEYDSPGVLRPSEVRPAFPASIRRQLRLADGKIFFRGWASGAHAEALDRLDDELAWRCSCERLGEIAQPPVELRGKVTHLADHDKLAYRGVMSPSDEQSLRTLFANQPDAQKAIDQLAEVTRRKTTIAAAPPASFQIPANLDKVVEVTPSSISISGPVSPELRDELARTACHYTLSKPLNDSERAAFIADLEQQGDPLTPPQREAIARYFNGMWQMDLFIQVLAGTGAPQPGHKTSCELLEEQQKGAIELTRQMPATGTIEPLTEEQIALLKSFELTPEMTSDELLTRLKAAKLSGPRAAAVESFLNQIPTIGERNKAVCIELLKAGSLTKSQRDWLLKDAREQYAWRQAVGDLFVRAHTVVYPWSGDYSEGGTPFDWMYTWVLQPLMTTTFALLAFYVASAAFRAFRAKNLEATLLLVTALIILFRATMFAGAVQVPLPDGSQVGMDRIYAFVMSVFNTAGNRAIMIGIALGIASTSLKVLLGIDRSYLGSDD